MSRLGMVEAFEPFLDFLSNPEKYRDLAEKVMEAAKAEKDLIEKQRKIKDIDKWRADEGVRIGKALEDIENAKADIVKQKADLKAKNDAFKLKVKDKNQELNKIQKALDNRADELKERESNMNEVDAIKAEYLEKLDELNKEREEFQARVDKLKAAAGGI